MVRTEKPALTSQWRVRINDYRRFKLLNPLFWFNISSHDGLNYFSRAYCCYDGLFLIQCTLLLSWSEKVQLQTPTFTITVSVTALLPRKTIWWYRLSTIFMQWRWRRTRWAWWCHFGSPWYWTLCTAVGLSNKKLVCIWRRELRSDNEIFMIQIKYIAQ